MAAPKRISDEVLEQVGEVVEKAGPGQTATIVLPATVLLELVRELQGHRGFEQHLSEVLNSGDGTYRP